MYTVMEVFYFFQYGIFSWWLTFCVRFVFASTNLICWGIRWGSHYKGTSWGLLLINWFLETVIIVCYSRFWKNSCWKLNSFDQKTSSVTERKESADFSKKSRCIAGFIPPICTTMACSNAALLGFAFYCEYEKLVFSNSLTGIMVPVLLLFWTYEVLEFLYFFWFKAFSWWTTLFMRFCMIFFNCFWMGVIGTSHVDINIPPWRDDLVIFVFTMFGLSGFNVMLCISCIACYWVIRRHEARKVEPFTNSADGTSRSENDQL